VFDIEDGVVPFEWAQSGQPPVTRVTQDGINRLRRTRG
jgi:hypothetical protein